MSRIKVDYGIDLGTTNSAICRIENGEPIIIKSDQFQKDTTPSCVAINKKQIISCGDAAYNARGKSFAKLQNDPDATVDDTYIEFKRTMGTDTEYPSIHLARSLSSQELSAEVLKKLKSYVTDENVAHAVITVPAKFNATQINATQEAAELAGLAYCELLQEPTAASIAYGIKAEDMDGRWLVFDFGGGTFDAALMEVEEGIMSVLDTEGDNHLGGTDLDFAIVDDILIPHLQAKYSIESHLEEDTSKSVLRRHLKKFAEETKIALSSKDSHAIYEAGMIEEDDEGEEVDLDLTVPLAQYESIVEPIFQKAVDICRELLKRNNLKGADLKTVVFVGGPTFQQTCRRMVSEQLGCTVDTSVDPMTAVAVGATIFASTKSIPGDLQVKDTTRVQLKVEAPESTVEIEEGIGVEIDRGATEGTLPDQLFLELANADGSWSSGRSEFSDDSEVVYAQLNEGKINTFTIRVFDGQGNEFPCQPSSCSILQGMQVAEATLPFHIMVRIQNQRTGKVETSAIGGLEKGQNLPAKGKDIFQTQRDIRPGNASDTIDIEVYEGEKKDIGTSPKLCKLSAKGVINGEDISGLIPAKSDVEITLELDSSRRVKGSAYFRHTDDDIDIELEKIVDSVPTAEAIESDIEDIRAQINVDEDGYFAEQDSEVNKILEDLDEAEAEMEKGGMDDATRDKVNEKLRRNWKKIQKLEQVGQWPKAEEDLDAAFDRLNEVQAMKGDAKTKEMQKQLEVKAEQVRADKNTKLAEKLEGEIGSLVHSIVRKDPNYFLAVFANIEANFDTHDWTNRAQAQQIMEGVKRSIQARDYTVETLQSALGAIFNCMANPQQLDVSAVDKGVLTR